MKSFPNAFKIGAMKLDRTSGGVLFSDHSPTKSSLCSGDSGGPALLLHGKYPTVIGVASTGTNGERNGKCVLSQGGQSAHVDIQSASSLGFLSNFPTVEYATWANVALAKLADDAKTLLIKGARERSLSKMKRVASDALKSLSSSRVDSADERYPHLQQARVALAAAKAASALNECKANLNAATRALIKISRLGIT